MTRSGLVNGPYDLPEADRSDSAVRRGRLAAGLATTALAAGVVALSVFFSPGAGSAQAQLGFRYPRTMAGGAHRITGARGEQPVPMTGNHITDPLNWDWNTCHTYYFLWSGMGNVSNMIWDGENPPPRPAPPPMGLYCDPGTFFGNCRISDHP